MSISTPKSLLILSFCLMVLIRALTSSKIIAKCDFIHFMLLKKLSSSLTPFLLISVKSFFLLYLLSKDYTGLVTHSRVWNMPCQGTALDSNIYLVNVDSALVKQFNAAKQDVQPQYGHFSSHQSVFIFDTIKQTNQWASEVLLDGLLLFPALMLSQARQLGLVLCFTIQLEESVAGL